MNNTSTKPYLLTEKATRKKTGAWLVRFALEQLGVRFTFGIPGVHNTEIYDELNKSDHITPVLVTHEGGGAFMADAISRTTDSIGTCLIVPAAGVTHAASGIAEASLDGIAMLVISGGVRTDTGSHYQLHDMDQHALLAPITKATFKVLHQKDIINTLYEAYVIATSGEPGPVFVEIPTNISLFKGAVPPVQSFKDYLASHSRQDGSSVDERLEDALDAAAKQLVEAKRPGLFLGWGAAKVSQSCIALAEYLGSPVSTTLQGLSVFPGNHPLHCGMGFGAYAVPAAEQAFKDCDCLLAIGTRFSEIPTGSFSMNPPKQLIHLDINPDVFNKNYPASTTLQGDAAELVPRLLNAMKRLDKRPRTQVMSASKIMSDTIKQDKERYIKKWHEHSEKQQEQTNRVCPASFFGALRQQLKDDAFLVADDGNHTFLTAELMPIHASKHFICPSDFNCMGYCIPATIACKLANPSQQVVGIVGDGAMMMTAMELVTATTQQLGIVVFVFNDGELSQISQAQNIPYNRKTCTVLGGLNIKGVADATGAEYLRLETNEDIATTIEEALKLTAQKRPIIVDVNIDYSKATRFTEGVVAANLKRFSLKDKARFIGRALKRKVTG